MEHQLWAGISGEFSHPQIPCDLTPDVKTEADKEGNNWPQSHSFFKWLIRECAQLFADFMSLSLSGFSLGE